MFSGRSRQRLKTEILLQRLDQLPILGRCPVQAEAGVVMLGGRVFVAPQTARRQVDDLLTTLAQRDFQAQVEFDTDHHRQLADEHQTVFGHVAQKADGFVGDAVEHSQKIWQLMPFDSTVGKHTQFAMQGSITEPHSRFGTGLCVRPALPAPGVALATCLSCQSQALRRYRIRSAPVSFDYSSPYTSSQLLYDNRHQKRVGRTTAAALRVG